VSNLFHVKGQVGGVIFLPEESFSLEEDFADIFSSYGAGSALRSSYEQNLGIDFFYQACQLLL